MKIGLKINNINHTSFFFNTITTIKGKGEKLTFYSLFTFFLFLNSLSPLLSVRPTYHSSNRKGLPMHWVATTWSEPSIKARGSQPSEVSFKLAVQVKNCPCCSHRLLQHIRNNRVYWFCRSCWQEMPLLNLKIHDSFSASVATISSEKNRFILENKDGPRGKTNSQ